MKDKKWQTWLLYVVDTLPHIGTPSAPQGTCRLLRVPAGSTRQRPQKTLGAVPLKHPVSSFSQTWLKRQLSGLPPPEAEVQWV